MTGFMIPNQGGLYPVQSRVFEADWLILAAGASGRGVASGCEITEQAVPDGSVAVADGSIVIDRTLYLIGGLTLDLDDAHPTMDRLDLIYADSSGNPSARTGTPDTSPTPPEPADNEVGLGFVTIPATDTAIQQAQIADKRIFVPIPSDTSALWTPISASSDLTRSSSNALTVDDVLQVTLAANTKYALRGRSLFTVRGTIGALGSGLKFGITGPASPTYLAITRQYMRDSLTAKVPSIVNAYDVTGISLTITQSTFTVDWEWEAIVHNGSTAGTFGPAWGQAAAQAENTIRRAGSYLEHRVA